MNYFFIIRLEALFLASSQVIKILHCPIPVFVIRCAQEEPEESTPAQQQLQDQQGVSQVHRRVIMSKVFSNDGIRLSKCQQRSIVIKVIIVLSKNISNIAFPLSIFCQSQPLF